MAPGLSVTGAHSSRVSKPGSKSPSLRRSSSSPFASFPRTKPGSALRRSKTLDDEPDEEPPSRPLKDRGPIRSLAGLLKLRDVKQCLTYINENMFDDIPESSSGMNSTKLVEIRSFRRSLPPVASITHIIVLSKSPTQAEREIAQLVLRGIVRKLTVPRRGVGSTMIGECLVLVDLWDDAVERNEHLPQNVKEKYIKALREHPTSSKVPIGYFTPEETVNLIRSGFLTASSPTEDSTAGSFRSSDLSARGTMSSLGSAGLRFASGTVEAVGGANAIHDAGGRISGLLSGSSGQSYNFTLPSIGLYLRLLSSAREHLVDLLSRSSYKEAPADLLRERWNGGVAISEKPIARFKGLSGPVLPGRTRKWKQFYGLKFEYVLEECLGTGLIEGFDTGSVGLGVRAAA